MSIPWTLERMIEERNKAYRTARRLITVRVHYREIAPHYVFGEDCLTVNLNPMVSHATYIPKSHAPRWVKEWCKDRKQKNDGKDHGNKDEHFLTAQAYAQFEAVIIRKKGFNGYIQDELPF